MKELTKENIALFEAAREAVQEQLAVLDMPMHPYDINMGLFVLSGRYGITALKGILGFIQHGRENGLRPRLVASNVIHDVIGAFDKFMFPRTYDYANHYKEVTHAGT